MVMHALKEITIEAPVQSVCHTFFFCFLQICDGVCCKFCIVAMDVAGFKGCCLPLRRLYHSMLTCFSKAHDA